jgi:DNA (cytosine-5)-methyltransferase 1
VAAAFAWRPEIGRRQVRPLKPWRTAAEIIDWSLPCPSIFDTSAEIMAKYGLRAVRPLQPATMARIAKGVKRYVLDAAKPFIVNLTHHGAGQAQGIDDPLATVTARIAARRRS